MTRISAADYQAMIKGQAKKPVKQAQGSNKGKALPLTEVRTTGTLSALKGYSEVKQDVLSKIQELHTQASEQLNHLEHNESLPVWALMQKCRHAMEIVEILKI